MTRKIKVGVEFRADDRITRAINRATRSVRVFSKKSSKAMRSVNKATQALGNTLKTGLKAGFAAATTGALALAAATAKVVTTGAGFEKSLVSAAVKFKDGVERGTPAFQALEKEALRVGETTEFSASQAAEGLNFLALAGFNSQQAIASLNGVVNLATASNLELAEASDIATDTLGAMGLMSEDSAELQTNLTRVMDVMAKTTASTNTDMTQLFAAIKAGGPIATKAGASIEEYASLVGTMANAGIKGETAGTALRNMFLRLQAPTGKAAQLVKEYIGNIEDKKTGKMISMTKILGRLTEKMGKLSDVKQSEIMSLVFGLRAVGPAAIALGAGSTSIETLTETLENATGTSSKMAGEIRNTVAGSLDSLKSAAESVILSLFKLDNTGMKGVIDSATEWLRANRELIASKVGEWVNWLSENWRELVDTMLTIGKVVAVIMGVITVVKGLTAALTLLNLVMMANPVVLIIMAIIAAITALAAIVVVYWDEIKLGFQVAAEFISHVWDIAVENITAAVEWLIDKFDTAWTFIKFGWHTVSKFFTDTWDFIVEVFDNAVKFLLESGPIKWLIDGFEFMGEVFDTVAESIGAAWDWIVDKIRSAGEWIMSFIQPIIDGVKSLINFGEELGADLFAAGQDDDEDGTAAIMGGGNVTQMVSPQDRTVREIEERNVVETRKTELTIRDETGRAQVTKGAVGAGMKMQRTGTF